MPHCGPTVNLLPSRTQGSSVLLFSVTAFHPSPPEDSFLWLNSEDEKTFHPWCKILRDPDPSDKTRRKCLFPFMWGHSKEIPKAVHFIRKRGLS